MTQNTSLKSNVLVVGLVLAFSLMLLSSCSKRGSANVEVQSLKYGLNLEIVQGNNQTAIPGRLFGRKLIVKVTNYLGQPVEGMTVDFSLLSGGNYYLTQSSVVSDASGNATIEVKGPDDFDTTGTIKAQVHGTPLTQTFTLHTNSYQPGLHFEVESTLGTTITAGHPFSFIVRLVNADGTQSDFTGPLETIWQMTSANSWTGRQAVKMPISYQCEFFQGRCDTPANGVTLYDSRQPTIVYMGDGNSGYQDVFAYELTVQSDVPARLAIATGKGGPSQGAEVLLERKDITTDSAPIKLAGAIVDSAGNYISDAGPMSWSSDHTEISTNFSASTGEEITFSPITTIAYSPEDPLFSISIPYGTITGTQLSAQYPAATSGNLYISPGAPDHFQITAEGNPTDLIAGVPYKILVNVVDAHDNIVGKSINGSGYDGTRFLTLEMINYFSAPVTPGGTYPWFGPSTSLSSDGNGNYFPSSSGGNIVLNSLFLERFFYGRATIFPDYRLIFFDATNVAPHLTIHSDAITGFPAVNGSKDFSIKIGPAHHLQFRVGNNADAEAVCNLTASEYINRSIDTLISAPFNLPQKPSCYNNNIAIGGGTLAFAAGDTLHNPTLYYTIEDVAGNYIASVQGYYSTSTNLGDWSNNFFRNVMSPAAGTLSSSLTFNGVNQGMGGFEIWADYTENGITKTYRSYLLGEVFPSAYDHFEIFAIQSGNNLGAPMGSPANVMADREFTLKLHSYDVFGNRITAGNAASGSLQVSLTIPSGQTPVSIEGNVSPVLPGMGLPTTVPIDGNLGDFIFNEWKYRIPNVLTGPVTFHFSNLSNPAQNRSFTVNPVAGDLNAIDVRTTANDPATSIAGLPLTLTTDEIKTYYMVRKDSLGNITTSAVGTWTLPNLTPNSLDFNSTGASSLFMPQKPGTADNLTVTYTQWNGTANATYTVTTGPVTLKSGDFAKMSFNIPSPITAGVPVNIDISLKDSKGNTLTHINGPQNLTFNILNSTATLLNYDANLVKPANGNYTFTNGVTTIPFTFYNSLDTNTRIQINATIDGVPGVGTSRSGDITIENSALDHIHIMASDPFISAGQNSTMKVYAEDHWGNQMKSGTGSDLKVRVNLTNGALSTQDVIGTTFTSPTDFSAGNNTQIEGYLTQGYGTFDITSTKAGTMTFTAVATANGSPGGTNTLETLEIRPLTTIAGVQWALLGSPAANHNASAVTGIRTLEGNPIQVQVVDTYGNVITTDNSATFTASLTSGTQSFYPGSVTGMTVAAGTATYSALRLTRAEDVNLRISLDSHPSWFVDAPIRIFPNGIRQTIIILPNQTFTEGGGDLATAITGTPFNGVAVNAGSNFNFTVRVVDSAFNTISGNTDISLLQTDTITDPFITFTPGSSGTLVGGSGTFNATVKRQGTHKLIAMPTLSGSISQLASSSFSVNPLSASKLVVLLPGQTLSEGAPNLTSAISGASPTQVAGTSFNVRVETTDAYYNKINSLSGVSIGLTPSDINSDPVSNVSSASGESSFTVTNYTAGTSQSITASAGGYSNSASTLYAINPAAATQCILSYGAPQVYTPGKKTYATALTGSAPSTYKACTSITVTAMAVDPYFNVDPNYSGSVAIDTTDDVSDATIASSNFTSGLKSFTFTPATASAAHHLQLTCTGLTSNQPVTHDIALGNKAWIVPYFTDYQTFDSSKGHLTLAEAVTTTTTIPDFVAGSSQKVTVVGTDACFNVIDDSSTSVTLSSTGANSAVLDGAQTLSHGYASFTQLKNYRSGTNYKVQSTNTSTYASKDSSLYNVQSGPASKLLVLLPGETFDNGQANASLAAAGTPYSQTKDYSFQVKVYGTDDYFNLNTNDSSTVVTIAPTPGGAFSVQSPAGSNSLSSGIATFTVVSSAPVTGVTVTASGTGYTGVTSDSFDVLGTLSTPTLAVSDPTTSSTSYLRQLSTSISGTQGGTVTAWCLTETATRPVNVNLSNNKTTCSGTNGAYGARDADGWYTGSLPGNISVSSGDGSKTLYLWVADNAKNVSTATVSTSITLDTVKPATPTLTFSGSYSATNTPSLTISGDTDANSYCLIEQDAVAADPSVPLYNNACWSTLPSTATLTALGNRKVFLFTKDLAQNVSLIGASAYKTIYYDPNNPTGFNILGLTGNTDLTNDNHLGTTVTPTVSWSAATDATSINYAVVIKEAGSPVAGCSQNINNTATLNMSGCNLVNGHSYTAWVTATDAAGNQTAAGNDGYAFDVDTTAPAAFAVNGVTGGADSTTNNILSDGNHAVINWAASSGQTSYKVRIYKSDQSTVQCSTQTTGSGATSYDFSTCALDYANLYYARVEAWDDAGNMTLGGGGNYAFTVKPQAASYKITFVNPGDDPVAGLDIPLKVTAVLGDGTTTDTSFVGSQTLTFSTTGGNGDNSICSSGLIMTPEFPTTATFTNGEATINTGVILKKTESGRTISVDSTIGGVALHGDSSAFNVVQNIKNCDRFYDGTTPASNALSNTTVNLTLGQTKTIYALKFDAYGNFIGQDSIEWQGSNNTIHTPDPRVGTSTTIKAVELGSGDITIAGGGTNPKVTISVTGAGAVSWDSTVSDSLSNTIIGSNTIKKSYFYDASTDATTISSVAWYKNAVTTSWYSEAAATNLRGNRTDFPARSFLVATDSGLDIIDATTNKLWMRFNAGSKYAINSDLGVISDVVAAEGKIFVAMAASGTDTGGLIILDFINDKIFQLTPSPKYLTQSGVAQKINQRNIAGTLSVDSTFTALPANERILSLAVRRNNGVDWLAIGTSTRALLLKVNSATPNLFASTSTLGGTVDAVALAPTSTPASNFNFYYSESGVGLHKAVPSAALAANFADTSLYNKSSNAKLPVLSTIHSIKSANQILSTNTQNQIMVASDAGLTVISENATFTSATAKNYNNQGSGTVNPSSTSAVFGAGIMQSLGATSGYAQAADSIGITNTGTIDFFFRPDSLLNSGSSAQRLLSKGTIGTTGSYGVDFNRNGAGKVSLWLNMGGSVQELESTTTSWNKGQWYHVSAVFTASKMDFYIDGTKESTQAINLSAFSANSSTLRILGDGTVGSRVAIDELRISKTDRNGGAASITVPTTSYSTDANVIYLYHFNEITGSAGSTTAATTPAATSATLNGDIWMSAPIYKGSDTPVVRVAADGVSGTSSAEVITGSAWTEINSLHSTATVTDSNTSYGGSDVFFFHSSAIVDKDIGIIHNNGTRDQLILNIR